MAEASEKVKGKRRTVPSVMGTAERVVKDLEQAKLVARRLETDTESSGSQAIEERFADRSSEDHDTVSPAFQSESQKS